MMKCPLCQLELFQYPIPVDGGFLYEYHCRNQADNLNGNFITHYNERISEQWVIMIVPPYKIYNYLKTDTSDIKMKTSTKVGMRYRTILKDLPLIHPDTEENLIRRLQTLVTFS